jgi:predicted nucleotidyltransferase
MAGGGFAIGATADHSVNIGDPVANPGLRPRGPHFAAVEVGTIGAIWSRPGYNAVADSADHLTRGEPASLRAEDLLRLKRDDIVRVAARHGARNVRVFGSVARGDADDTSDIDLLVDMAPGHSLFDMGGLLMELQALLQREVDVVSERGLRREIRDRVLREAIPL